MSGDAPDETVRRTHAWRRYAEFWRDVWRAPVVLVIAAAMGVVAFGMLSRVAAGDPPSALAWMNGAAAVITAVAALHESRRGRAELADHEVRLRMLEK